MTLNEKREIISAVTTILEIILKVDETKTPAPTVVKREKESAPTELLTIRQCVALVPGLPEHALRKLVKQNKIKHIECGNKCLISKAILLDYIEGKNE